MKKLLLLALTAMIMAGCESDTLTLIDTSKEYRYIKDNEVFYTIDSCEYINRGVYGGDVLVHKGNCKFCAERRKQELKELVEQLKDK